MPPSNNNIGTTLKKMAFENIEQFMNDLNNQFAIIQNSPLFKGIPGESIIGEMGPPGERGSRLFFVEPKMSEFLSNFDYVTSEKDVNIEFFNINLDNFEQNKKLLKIFKIDYFVDGDIIVMPDSLMGIFNDSLNALIDSGIYFNEEEGILKTLGDKVAKILAEQLEQLGLGVFKTYKSLGKNYADNSNTNISNAMTQYTAFSPYIPKYNPKTGIELTNHTFYGYSKEFEFDTTIFGSIKEYYQMLHKTIINEITQNFNSEYVPGKNNIPKMIMIQNDFNNGFYFGNRDEKLSTFASLYKNNKQHVVLKSHSSPLVNEYSYFEMGIKEFYYNKVMRVGEKFVGPLGEIDVIKAETMAAFVGDDYDSNGVDDWEFLVLKNYIRLNAQHVRLTHCKNTNATTIVTTNSSGWIQKNYKMKTTGNGSDIKDDEMASGTVINNLFKYAKAILDKLNNNYYTKTQWANNGVDVIRIHNNNLIINGSKFEIGDAKSLFLKMLKSADFLSTDNNGKVLKKYRMYKWLFSMQEDDDGYVKWNFTPDVLPGDKKLTVPTWEQVEKILILLESLTHKLFKKSGNLKIKSFTTNDASMTNIIRGNLTLPQKTNGFLTTDAVGNVMIKYLFPPEITRSNQTVNITDLEYGDRFISTPENYDYLNFNEKGILSGKHGNFFMMLFRKLAARNAFRYLNRELRFIAARVITNDMLDKNPNWYVADGTHGTDDMRNKYAIGMGSKYSGYDVVTKVGSNSQTLDGVLGTWIQYLDPDAPRPPAPINLKIDWKNDTNKKAKVSWTQNNSGDVDYYNVFLNGKFFKKTTNKFETVTGLHTLNNTVSVQAVHKNGNKSDKTNITVPIAESLEPRNLSGTSGNESINISWSKPLDWNTHGNVVRYEILVNGAVYTTTTSLNKLITNLPPEYDYDIGVKAVYNDGTKSNTANTTVHITSPTTETEKLRPKNLHVSDAQFIGGDTTEAFNLRFYPPVDKDHHNGIKEYEIFLNGESVMVYPTTVSNYSVLNVRYYCPNGTKFPTGDYDFKIRANYTDGIKSWFVPFNTISHIETESLEPEHITFVTVANNNKVVIEWDKSTDHALHGGIKRYEVQLINSWNGTSSPVIQVNYPTETHTFLNGAAEYGDQYGDDYNFTAKVRAIYNDNTVSGWAENSKSFTPNHYEPRSVSVNKYANHQVRINWGSPKTDTYGKNRTGYKIYVDGTCISGSNPINNHSLMYNLGDSSVHYIKVCAHYDDGTNYCRQISTSN